MNRRFTRVFAATAVVAALAAAGNPGAAASGAPDPLVYVAMGDSYASYSGVLPQVGLNCTRSSRNYPSLVAAALAVDVFRDVTCGGASTTEMSSGWTGTLGLAAVPPQLDALTADTDVVTIGIGGNDEGLFSELTTGECLNLLPAPFGTSCVPHYTQGGINYFSDILSRTDDRVAAVLQEIHNRAPGAAVFLVGVPAVTPEQGGCWSPRAPYLSQDVPFMHAVELEINRMWATVAPANGATFVDVRTNSIGHDVCRRPGVRWVEGLIPDPVFGQTVAPFHPNYLAGPSSAADVLAAIHAVGVA